MNLEEYSLEDIKRGYTCEEGTYRCMMCSTSYAEGEVYPVGGHFYLPEKAIVHHMQAKHGERTQDLICLESKYNTLTDNQKKSLILFASDKSDKEIAKELGISTSTVRHQKFMFREKAKQAKHYLSVYQHVFENNSRNEEAITPVHDQARMVDMRYVITEEEQQKVINTYFESLSPLRLKEFPAREKKKMTVLRTIIEEFERERSYSEREVSAILKEIYHDFPTVRRYLIQYGFMKRAKDGAQYWRT